LTALRNWEDEAFAYFRHPVTNAYTEALNGVIRIVNRVPTRTAP
jgi:transposase